MPPHQPQPKRPPQSHLNSLMHLVELFLPVTDNDGNDFDDALFAQVGKELTDKFGGMTSFSRSPAEGLSEDGGKKVHDEIIVMEVICNAIDREWWKRYRKELEARFEQDEILIRASQIEKL